jgi:hypothetical protein
MLHVTMTGVTTAATDDSEIRETIDLQITAQMIEL